MIKPRGAVAVFVKTPGYSAVKTRLAQTTGQALAEEFHTLCVQALTELLAGAQSARAVSGYWAVAEPEALDHPLWRAFPRVAQPAGGLGQRLAGLYDTLRARHRHVVFLGADAPQLELGTLALAIDLLEERLQGPAPPPPRFVVGRAEDGGYYLFGGFEPLPASVWLETPYSDPRTADEFLRRLEAHGEVLELPPLRDVDTIEDLRALRETLAERVNLPPGLRELSQWLAKQRLGK